MQFTLATAITLLSSAAALTITEPKTDSVVQRSGSLKLSWTTVATDPTEFKIAFRRVGDSSLNAVTELPGKVSVSDKTVEIDASKFPLEGKYTIYAISTDNKAGILAESHAFEAKGPAATKSTTSGVSAGTSTTGTSDKTTSAVSGTSSGTGKKTDGKTTSGSAAIGMSLTAVVAAVVTYALF